jgi:hypothetical protein
MISTCFDRLARQALFAALLLGMATGTGCASADISAAPTAGQPPLGRHLRVERNGFSKQVRFLDKETSRTVVMGYKGIPVAWGSPINILVDEDIYERESHRVRYRFQHPLSAERMVLLARSKSHSVANVPVRSGDTMPVIQIFDGDEKQLRGTLQYDGNSPVLFSGEIGERRVEIEQVSGDIPPDRGIVQYLLFPFPLKGDFVIRVEGREAARFTQQRQHGFKSPYDLSFEEGLDEATRDDAMLAFVVFDRMKDFVQSAQ